MKEQVVAEKILSAIGGKENIKSIEHCATRLRIIVNDKSKIDEKAVENIDGVKGQFFAAAQYQIILGTGFVNKVYGVIVGEGQSISTDAKKDAYSDMTFLQKISRTLGDVFVPIIPALVATGLFMGLRGLLVNMGVEMSDTFLMFTQILTDTAFAFLPALVTWSTMKKFGGNQVLGIIIGLMLVAPQLPNAYGVASGAESPIYLSLLGLSIPIVGYQGSVLPAIILGIFAAKVEKTVKKIVPDVLDLIITPFVTLLLSMIVGLIVIGPIMHWAEVSIFINAIEHFMKIPYGIGAAIIGGTHQLIVVTGVHHALNALEVQLLSTTGVNPFNAIISAAIVAQGGAALAVALKTKNKKKRALYISSSIPAFLGITEPAIFGINLRFGKPFIFGLVGGAVGGMIAGITNLAGTGMGVTAIPGLLLYMNDMVTYIIVCGVALAISFGLTYTFFKTTE